MTSEPIIDIRSLILPTQKPTLTSVCLVRLEPICRTKFSFSFGVLLIRTNPPRKGDGGTKFYRVVQQRSCCRVISWDALDDLNVRYASSDLVVSDMSIDLKKVPSQSLLWALPLENYDRSHLWLTLHSDHQITYLAATLVTTSI